MRIDSLLPSLAVLVLAALPCRFALASTVDPSQIAGIVAFGDSLTDAGNASIATGGVDPGPGYATRPVTGVPFPVGYYTNPPVAGGPAGLWIDQLAGQLGVGDPAPALAPLGGTNYAVGSAMTGSANPQDMQNQVALFAAHGAAPANDLYTFWGGANDIFAAQNPVTAANNIAAEIKQLAALGAQNFLWLNLPALGDIPELSGTVASAAANAASAAFDAQWAVDVMALDQLGLNVIGVDVNTLFNNILANPAAYGFTNVTQACLAVAGCDPNTFLYFDSEHPTTSADSLVADLAYEDLTGSPAPTPEPSTLVLLASGLAGVGAVVRRRTA